MLSETWYEHIMLNEDQVPMIAGTTMKVPAPAPRESQVTRLGAMRLTPRHYWRGLLWPSGSCW